ncbi:MAG TPA: putative oxidoreductase C-terminal domain-containing protein, partial [Cyclobacteriaceae bacterium]|nr:putative oxidoreductase C-terminal domain-containing protein [Cyclobacteriaceae bacterium]
MKNISILALTLALFSCQPSTKEDMNDRVQLVTLDPGHFHAALVQKSMYDEVDSVVHVYSPGGSDLQLHLERIENFNNRETDPTHWKEEVYVGPDYFEKMLKDKSGNVVVISGNNKRKTEYISKSLGAGFNVLADKPMVIDAAGFAVLQKSFETAEKNNLLLYDIMTERYEITTILQREFSMLSEVFGQIEKGTPENPAITKESVHHFYKYVSGSVLTRPGWFMDVDQQGEGIVDVSTHLVDLVQWECFPEQIIDYTQDIEMNSARRWYTDMTLSEFKAITKSEGFPDYLKKDIVNDTILRVYSNGEINFKLRGVNAKVSVTWAYRSPGDGGDTHYSIMRGTKANLIIRQGAEQQYKPTLYIEPVANDQAYESVVTTELKKIQGKYPGVELKKNDKGWEVVVPDHYKTGHEAHFAQVTE